MYRLNFAFQFALCFHYNVVILIPSWVIQMCVCRHGRSYDSENMRLFVLSDE